MSSQKGSEPFSDVHPISHSAHFEIYGTEKRGDVSALLLKEKIVYSPHLSVILGRNAGYNGGVEFDFTGGQKDL